uniref:Ig-like domain-containing protein n=1 Tax=Oryctolagus cuniculus TaxID=9986 RepID=G1TGX7_RABIT
METELRWLLLVAVLKGVQCQSVEESGGRLVKPDETLTLTCTVSGIDLSSNAMSWVRQAPGEGLEWIGTISTGGSTYYASWAKGRFTISKTSTTVDLKMTSLTAADTATYFCARDTVRGPHTEPRHKPPCRGARLHQGAHKTYEARFWSCTGAEGDEALVSSQGIGVCSPVTVLREEFYFLILSLPTSMTERKFDVKGRSPN